MLDLSTLAATVPVEKAKADMCCGVAAVKAVCSEYRIHNADVHLKEDCDVDDLVDCIEGSRVYIPCIYVLNKIDQVHQTYVYSCVLNKIDWAERTHMVNMSESADCLIRGPMRNSTCHASRG